MEKISIENCVKLIDKDLLLNDQFVMLKAVRHW